MFRRKVRPTTVPVGFRAVLSGPDLLASSKRVSLITKMREAVGTTEAFWNDYYLSALERIAVQCQDLPATRFRNHAYDGGLLDHILETACYSMVLRQGVDNPVTENVEDMVQYREQLTYAFFIASLLRSSESLLVSREVVVVDDKPSPVNWFIPLDSQGRCFKSRFVDGDKPASHHSWILTLAHYLASPDGLSWLFTNSLMFKWIVEGQVGRDNVISKVTAKAQRHSIDKNLGHSTAPDRESLISSLAMQVPGVIRDSLSVDPTHLNHVNGFAWVLGDTFFIETNILNRIVSDFFNEHTDTDYPEEGVRKFLMDFGYYIDNSSPEASHTIEDSTGNTRVITLAMLNVDRLFQFRSDVSDFVGRITLGQVIKKSESEASELVASNQASNTFFGWLRGELERGKVRANRKNGLIVFTELGAAIQVVPLLKRYVNFINGDLPSVRRQLIKSGAFLDNSEGGQIFDVLFGKTDSSPETQVWVFASEETQSLMDITPNSDLENRISVRFVSQ